MNFENRHLIDTFVRLDQKYEAVEKLLMNFPDEAARQQHEKAKAEWLTRLARRAEQIRAAGDRQLDLSTLNQ